MMNPLLGEYKTPFGTQPFDKVENKHYEPAIDAGLKALESEIKTIAENKEAPSFYNTVCALDSSGELLERVCGAFFNVLAAESDDEMMEISQRISPKLSESRNNIFLNEKLFARIKEVYEMRSSLHLSTEEEMLLTNTFENFRESGATLNDSDKETYRRLSTELSQLKLNFEQNCLKDKNRYELLLTDEQDIKGLPESLQEAAAMEAKSRGKEGWCFTLSYPMYVPFLRYADARPLREKIYKAYMNVANKGDEFDNKEIIKRIVSIRLEIAKLMGCPNYACYALKQTMAKTPEKVYDLLNKLLTAYKPTALSEVNTIEGFAKGYERSNIELMPWDWSYYAEKLKDLRFEVNDEMTRPYFELSNVKKSIFNLATQLYGLTFKANENIPVYHKEVEAYEVYNEEKVFQGVLYTDFHPRKGKQSGAWMNDIKGQYIDGNGVNNRPHIIIVMNFSRPTETLPSLLSYDEVETFLHEFGHALHGLLANTTFKGLSGTNVYRDFVELPSQIMENFLTEKDFLDQIAIHHKTGEKIPSDLIQKLIDASNYNVGYACLRQLSFGLLDMAWHTMGEPFEGEVQSFEQEAWRKTQLLPTVEGASMSCAFGHIFSGGYAAGYYGYKWAEVLDADAFEAFKEVGIFNKHIARSFQEHILSKGGTDDPSVLYKRFRGKEATIDALLKRNGITVEK